ncbi:protein required for normal CLN1 and CLN2 G1 cyclin expression [Lithohypha guttulata]|uniref:Protein required for normal CLN1 and CLN2 G1 cyclin expression n=1 Tax=Lithohypha guttulata TaxID=1690604 RepID=A0AAN7T8K8_9EURO|nr:protein required for normal CLN1 and CLN2 G1 cyclin expression [Lithohypha guttulata]
MAGVNGAVDEALNRDYDSLLKHARWYNAPQAIDIPIGEEGEEVEIPLQDLEEPTELCQLLETEKAERKHWITVALSYAKANKLDYALEVLQQAQNIFARGLPKDRLPVLGCISWIYLLKSRRAPRVVSEAQDPDTKTKEHYLREATNVMNEAMRINPAHPPLYLTRGVVNLLRAALATSTKTGQAAENERADAINQALKCFDEAVRLSDERNLLALMGRARSLYLLRKYSQALNTYQEVLRKQPKMKDPDPRIGIGACMWQMGYHDHAKTAWERARQLNPNSNIAHTLLGIYTLRESEKYGTDDRRFETLYSQAMADYLKKAYSLDKQSSLTSAAFSTYFLNTKRWDQLEALAKKAIEQTDINATASDGWFVRARKEHELGNTQQANDAYGRADQARGGQNAGFFPAKFGLIQLTIESGDITSAKFRLEKLFERHKALEIMTLLGCIYAEDIFAAQKANPKEDKSAEYRKAIRMLETVRKNWKDDKAKIKTKPDSAVLLYLARLYEMEAPLESEKCLAEVESLQRQAITDEQHFDPNAEDFNELIQEHMPPQLHNNVGCFLYRDEAYEQALQRFEIALNATLKLHEKQIEEKQKAEDAGENTADLDVTDTDALVTTISYNLARTQEALGQRQHAIQTYEGLLSRRHPDYTDAAARLAYLALIESPQDAGPKKLKAMFDADHGHPEVRALMGWYFHSSKKKTANIAEDQEFRHYKHTLQQYDKHDVYSLIGMGNIHLAIARDMPRNTEPEKEKRTKMYQKAYEFFDKALQLDPRNAFAAQGIAVALCDDKKNFSEALQILVKVKDTIRDISVFQNLGHVYCELKQYSRSIDSYETALQKQIQQRQKRHDSLQPSVNGDAGETTNGLNGHAKADHKEDAQILACLSRVWLLKGKNDKSILSHTTALDLMQRALATAPDSPHLRFNVAFIQFQIVLLVNSLSDAERTLDDLVTAKTGLEEAIATFEEVATVPNPPYPKAMLEQRAAMSKGTMMKQVDRAMQQQSDYERANTEKLAEAKRRREEELRARDAAAQRRKEEEEAREAEVRRKREEYQEEAARKAEEFRQAALIREAAEYTTDEETGDRVKRQKKKKGEGRSKKRKARDDEDGFIEHDEDSDSQAGHTGGRERTPISGTDDDKEQDKQPKKKRKLERKARPVKEKPSRKPKEKEGKFKSQAVVVDSDDSEEEAAETPQGSGSEAVNDAPTPKTGGEDGDVDMQEDDAQSGAKTRPAPRQRKQLRTIADDDEDEEGEDVPVVPSSVPKSTSRVVEDDDDE